MYGTVARFKVKPGMDAAFWEIFNEWHRFNLERGVHAVADLMYRLENRPDEYILAVVFPDRDAYVANAEDPDTDRYYRRFRETLVEDPEWNDGEIVVAEGIGGS